MLGPRRPYQHRLSILHSDVVLAVHCVHHVLSLVTSFALLYFCTRSLLTLECRRDHHQAELEYLTPKWDKLFDKRNGGILKIFQPFFGYLGAVCTLLVVFFFNTISLWNRDRISVKVISTFVSPILVLTIWIIKKLTRRDDRRFKFFINLSNFRQFERCLQALDDLIYPGEVFDAGPSKHSIDMSPIHPQRLELFPDSRNNTLERLQDPIGPNHDVNEERPISFNRTDLILSPSQNNMRQDYFMAEPTQPQPVSPARNTAVERDAMPGRRLEPVAMPYPQHYHRPMLSPGSATSRRGLGNIHETDAELEANSMAGSDDSRSRLNEDFR